MQNTISIFILISIAFSVANASSCKDLIHQFEEGEVCQAGDQECRAALDTLYSCIIICAGNTSKSEIISCAKNSCGNINNSTVKNFYNKLFSCFESVLLFSVLFVLIALLF